MRRFGGSLLLGLAAATFFLSPVVEQLLRLTPARSYFLKYSPDRWDYSVLLGLILVIGLAVGSLWAIAAKFQSPWRLLCEAPIMLLFAMGIEHVIHLHLSRYPPLWNLVAKGWIRLGVTPPDGWFITGLVCGLAVIAIIAKVPRTWPSAKTLACGGAAALWAGCLMNVWRPPALLPASVPSAGAPLTRARQLGPGQPIVWLILDEWDYDLTFRRSDGKVFPEFDRLRRQSVFLENVRAAGKVTLTAIPSLLMGRPVREFRASNPSAARFVAVAPSSTESFPGPQTVFDTASLFGYHSQIVGWYHPYCRIFGAQVASCWWDSVMLPGARHGSPIIERAVAFLRDSIELEILPGGAPSNAFLKQFERVSPMVEQAALDAKRPGKTFSFLHLPLPHGPFFKLDSGGHMTALPSNVAGYQYGLEAADRALGEIRRAMESTGVWDEALVVVTSDHPYRYQFAGGYGNGRIPMMIKLPHQSAPVVYSNTFPAVDTKNLIEDFMQGRVGTPELAVAWLERDAPAQGTRAAGAAARATEAAPVSIGYSPER